MAEAQKLAIKPRTVLGKKVKRLRREGLLPGVVFGGHADSTPVVTDHHAFELNYRRWGTTTLISLAGLDVGEVSALVHGVSRDPRTGELLHVDFARVSLTEKTHTDVPIHFTGDAPAVKTLGAVLVHAIDHVRIEAFPLDIPHQIDVDLSGLEEIGDGIFVRDLAVDVGRVRILNDPDDLVVKSVPVKIEEEKPAAVEAVPVEGEVPTTPEGEAAAAVPSAAPGAAAPTTAPGAAAGAAKTPEAAAAKAKPEAAAGRPRRGERG